MWIQDVAELTCSVLCHKSTSKLNIATGRVVSFREIAEQTVKLIPGLSKVKGSVRTEPMPHNGYRAFDQTSTKKAFPNFNYTQLLTEGLKKICG